MRPRGTYQRRGIKTHSSSTAYQKRQDKVKRAKVEASKGRSLTTTRQEHKFMMIKLMKSGRSLRETKAMMKAVAVASTSEYMRKKDLEDILALEGGIHSIRATRNDAQQLMKIKFTPRSRIGGSRAERAAQFIMGDIVGSAFDWNRDGNLIRKGKPNPSVDGSSKGKIGKTTVVGAEKVLKDFKQLVRTLRQIQKNANKHSSGAEMRKASRGLRVSISRSIS